ncbi:MAG: TolC family protein [Selenomonadaceae bacterium]|nr:TolC family protein [Selenomonadaceae bacterium]
MKKNQMRKAWLVLAGILLAACPMEGSCADLSLQQAINMALEKNTALRITQKAEDKAAAAVREAKGNDGLSVSASDSLSFNKSSGSDHSSSNSLAVRATYPIYTGGKNRASIDSSELGLRAAVLTTQRARETLKLDVIKAYYDALQARKTVAVNQESVDKYQAHYTNVQQLYSAGSKAKIDVLRSSVELSNAQQNLIRSQNSYEVSLAKLRDLIDMDRDESLDLTDDFTYTAFEIALPECIDYAFRNRKDLMVDRYTLEQKELAIKMAKAGYAPSVNLSAGVDVLESKFRPTRKDASGWSAGLSAQWNLFDSGMTKAQVDAAETERDIAKLNMEKDEEAVDLELREAYYSMREAEKRLSSTSDAVRQAEEDYYIASEKYRAGEGIMLDIIDAEDALFTAQLNQISAQYDYVRCKAEVETAMGIGLNDAEQTSARNMTMDIADPQVPTEEKIVRKAVVPSESVADEMAGNEAGK